ARACRRDKVGAPELLAAGRPARVTPPRHVAMYLCRRHTDAPLGAIGKELGGRDLSTVVHALSAIEERLRRDAELRATVSLLEARLGGGSGWGVGWAVPGMAPRGARGISAMPRAPRRR